jgi:hypothetical protein
MIQNIYKSWITSAVGIFLLSLGGGYVLYNPTPDYIILSMLLAGGIALLFFPDDLITQLKSFLSKKSKQL